LGGHPRNQLWPPPVLGLAAQRGALSRSARADQGAERARHPLPAYANPYLAVDGALYREALAGGHLCLRLEEDTPYLVDFGEFDCGVLDFTAPQTCEWFARRILCEEMLDIGIDGWMADFGEYLPTDVRLSNGMDAMEAHNLWPVLWAQVNDQALAMRGRQGDAVFFMRAGFSGVSAIAPAVGGGPVG
jgi:alpha-glucosidase